MSIKPLDYNTMVPKTYEISSFKQTENMKYRNITESGFLNQEKNIQKNRNRVQDLEENQKPKILKDNQEKKQSCYRENKSKENKNTNEKLNNDLRTETLGHNVDIRI